MCDISKGVANANPSQPIKYKKDFIERLSLVVPSSSHEARNQMMKLQRRREKEGTEEENKRGMDESKK
jgi:hypothetical protein